MIDWKKARPVLMAGAGAYLLYTAYSLFQERRGPETAMPVWAIILFSLLFALAAVGIIVYAVILWKKADKEQKEYEEAERQREAAVKSADTDNGDEVGKEQDGTEQPPA